MDKLMYLKHNSEINVILFFSFVKLIRNKDFLFTKPFNYSEIKSNYTTTNISGTAKFYRDHME